MNLCSICSTPVEHGYRCAEHPVALYPAQRMGALVKSREELLHERMILEVADVLFAPLGEHATRVAAECVADLISDPARSMTALFAGALLIAHLDGADRVETARAFDLAGDCAEAIGRAVLLTREEEQRERLSSGAQHRGAYS